MVIKGKEINLRHVQAPELDRLIDLINSPGLKGDYARIVMKSPAILKSEFSAQGFSTESSEMLVIVDQYNAIVGTIGHFVTAHYSSSRELGFSIFSSENRNKGIATEAVSLLTRYLFESMPINRIQITMPVEHKACEKIAIKCGYVKEGLLRGTIFVRGKYMDTFMYSMLRSDFESAAL